MAYAHRQRSAALRAKTNCLISTAQRALRAVIPLTPPAPSPPAKALVGRGGQAVMGAGLRREINSPLISGKSSTIQIA